MSERAAPDCVLNCRSFSALLTVGNAVLSRHFLKGEQPHIFTNKVIYLTVLVPMYFAIVAWSCVVFGVLHLVLIFGIGVSYVCCVWEWDR